MTPDNTARNAQIVRLRRKGVYPSDIARRLGLSRNTVIGVVYRAGLSRPDVDRSEIMAACVRRGADAPRSAARLTEADAAAIRAAVARGASLAVLARQFGVSRAHIGRVARGMYWNDLTSRQPVEEPGASPEQTSEHVVSHTVAPTGADCAASRRNGNTDTAGATGVRLSGGANARA